MISVKKDNIEAKLADAREELAGVKRFPNPEFAGIIKELGFRCEMCARCCTKEFNDHVFLLDADLDIIREIDPDSITPAPYYEFCDQKGRFYVSGYALKTKPDGSCVFLENKRCKIYGSRPSICRVYPHMLHREADDSGRVDWRQISGLNEHGSYNSKLDNSECEAVARETRAYEEAYLTQMIGFFEGVKAHFRKNSLKHVQSIYDRKMREFLKGKCELEILVYYQGGFEKCTLKPDAD
ncbi:YkgJ family cysteine cluster protein [Methanosarcina sp. MSH10X1]|uniref:YkgJ family cysteine cluster protein n=1 Tax=Methanosarcina sp. MSH10X1 TaxID=2507075 RepID=UPI000FFBACA3|nr:YkgJ family cysteine cluster protein [Methanosarcina sp. MSH10X1]RXA16817.1 YkgJ family cysteine cluster protein [Methanosarcina sp. MSH10X1]